MHQIDRSLALTILVVTEDRSLSAELSQYLNMAGYHTLEAAAQPLALVALETGRPQVALIDAKLAIRDQWALCRLLNQRRTPGGLFKFLMFHELDQSQLCEAFEAGADDVVSLPICYGQLLARLRTAARVLEFDRRVNQQEPTDSVTGLLGSGAFTAQIRRHWSAAGGAASRLACIVIDLDFFAAIRESEGGLAASVLLADVVEELKALQTGTEVLGRLGGNRFGVMLTSANGAAAAAGTWAERANHVLAARAFQVGRATRQITVSCGVASCDTAQSVEQLLEQAAEALAVAKSSGRNRVVQWSATISETREVHRLGELFQEIVASDVLTPCTVFLQAGEPATHAAELMRQTLLEAIAVVDAGGRLVGLCTKDQVSGETVDSRSGRLVRDVMTSDVRRFSRQEEFASLMDFFNLDPLAWAVVAHDGRPVGLLNCDSLLALSQPVGTAALAAPPPYTDRTEYLLIPEWCPDPCGQEA
jgi:diguanylate cyclase (GGDEF)-like protein